MAPDNTNRSAAWFFTEQYIRDPFAKVCSIIRIATQSRSPVFQLIPFSTFKGLMSPTFGDSRLSHCPSDETIRYKFSFNVHFFNDSEVEHIVIYQFDTFMEHLLGETLVLLLLRKSVADR